MGLAAAHQQRLSLLAVSQQLQHKNIPELEGHLALVWASWISARL